MNIKTTAGAAEQLGLTRKTLIMWLQRHPELKPPTRIQPSNDFIWTDEDISKVEASRQRRSKGGRPKKK